MIKTEEEFQVLMEEINQELQRREFQSLPAHYKVGIGFV